MMAFLPAYSPELNPDEQVWNHTKADDGKRTIQRKDDMEKTILSAMLAILNKIDLVKSFFQLPDTGGYSVCGIRNLACTAETYRTINKSKA